MYWIDDALAVLGSTPPAPVAATNAIGWFTEGNEISGTPPTPVHSDWLNSQQAEGLNLLAGAGVTPVKTLFSQVLQAIRRITGGNTAAVSTSGTLTADNAGLVTVNASSANLSIALPAAASAGGSPLTFRIRRSDLTTNTVSLTLNGTDTWAPGAVTGSLVLQQSENVDLFSDGVSTWYVVQIGAGYRGVTKFTAAGTFLVPVGCTTVEVELWAGGSGSWASVSGIAGGGGSGGGYARKLIAGLSPGSSIAATVGAGGTAGTSGVAPTAGGSSSFGSYCSAAGGGVNGINTPAAPSLGNTAGGGTGGDLNLFGGDGGLGQSNQGGLVFNLAGYGGEGPFSGGVINSGTNGNPGRFPGGGASGAGSGTSGTTPYPGAAGAGGLIIVRAF
jgi:hypothetical protein